MKEINSAPTLLTAQYGSRRVTIGLDAPDELRRLSDARALTCPGCGEIVVLHAGSVRAHHFAHLPGTVCTLPATEPETEEHRAGKLLLARWLRERLPNAEIVVEAFLPQTGQRADVLAIVPERPVRRIALEFQCANLSAREWRGRHRLYREVGIEDLWLLGGSRLALTPVAGEESRGVKAIRTTELERALLWDDAPLLFLDAIGERIPAETLARFRPDSESQAHLPTGKLSAKPLLTLAFPFALLSWPDTAHPNTPILPLSNAQAVRASEMPAQPSDRWLWEWLTVRFHVTPETLPSFFGLTLPGAEAFACTAQAWQAALYYRFVHRRVGDGWWLNEVEAWARAYLPVARPVNPSRLRRALSEYQEILAAAGFLSLPMGYGRVNARILNDLTTLPAPPDPDETLRLARYRRTLVREDQTVYL